MQLGLADDIPVAHLSSLLYMSLVDSRSSAIITVIHITVNISTGIRGHFPPTHFPRAQAQMPNTGMPNVGLKCRTPECRIEGIQ